MRHVHVTTQGNAHLPKIAAIIVAVLGKGTRLVAGEVGLKLAQLLAGLAPPADLVQVRGAWLSVGSTGARGRGGSQLLTAVAAIWQRAPGMTTACRVYTSSSGRPVGCMSYTSSSGRPVGCMSTLLKQHLNTHKQQLRALGLQVIIHHTHAHLNRSRACKCRGWLLLVDRCWCVP